MPALLFDLVLAAAVAWVAWRALAARDLFVSVVLYIVFGLLMSLTWVRLGAGDVALAEAAIGAGLTGALFLDAVAELEPAGERSGTGGEERPRRLPAALLALAVGAGLVAVVAGLPRGEGGLGREVLGRLEESGIAQPVTAVLLDFRGFDTLLEMGVLLLAALGMLAAQRARDLSGGGGVARGDPVLRTMVGVLLPVLALTAAYLLLLGTRAPGGAFQAGAVLASGGVLLSVAGYRPAAALRGVLFRAGLLLGFGGLLAASAALALTGRRLLDYPAGGAPGLVLALEAAVTVSVAVTLAALFAGARADR